MKTYLKLIQALIALLLASLAFSAHAVQPTSYFIYDESGHLIGEYDDNGKAVQEHIWLGNRPVAVAVVNSDQTVSIDYVHTDQLDTPRVVTDSSQNVVWAWNSDPFGNAQPTGSLTYNLRFPGQYFDQETSHNYNWFRDYDLSTGRYVESDPIGLKGGVNTYAYVRENPLLQTDRLGLCPDCKKDCAAAYNKHLADNSSWFRAASVAADTSCSYLRVAIYLTADSDDVDCLARLNKMYVTLNQYYLRKYNQCLFGCLVATLGPQGH